ncbi:efflux RND transporter permease subunit [Fimbriiglobus ruber]|uniref:Cobalt-zinc-cadmium resistance protein CzcA / Cation efflux system protein CusA n=1 Tax=Fimbriiglobus ruber TaxID=1908690 RepID=A0A225DCR8_9BACT|nr:CusA/CzcA family heavy metal efflux RND transporter [Fimbriiglobus ruber]OWK35116.1 Cobalt-zinc-cadmium resistance protein CzcA / Cation efflux system protein CusA [Fimbriiglobus ruber]
MLNRIIDFSLRFRFLILLGAVASAVVGAVSLRFLDIDAFPDTTPVQVQVNTTAPALGPEEVEQQITFPIEQALGGLAKLQAVRSVSKPGLSQVVILFEDGTDVYFARQIVNERLNSVALPAGIDRPKLGPVTTGLGEVFHYVVSLKGVDVSALPESLQVEKLTYLRTVQDWQIRPKLRPVPGVAEVNSWGGFEKQYQVRVNPDRLYKYGLTFDQTVEAVARNNKNVGGGSIRQNSQSFIVQGQGRTANEEEISDIVVAAKDGVPVRVRDVAVVSVGHELRRGSATANGRGEVVLGLCFLTTGENSKTVSTALRQKLDEIGPTLPPDVEVRVVYDRTELVDMVIDTVRKNLFEGGLLVVAVLFAFLGNLRAAAIVALAIPLCMLFAFSGMLRFGIAASLLSLGAIDFGMVVDSSVVMIENCVRRIAHEPDRPKLDVVRDAAVEVRRPTLFGELIIMIVYLPILTLEGTSGKLFRPMALTVLFALAGSMVLSMTLMPVLASLVLPRRIRETQPLLSRLALLAYRPVLSFSMTFKLPVLAFAICSMVVAFGLIAPNLGSEFIPKLSEGAIAANITRLPGTDLSESNRLNTITERMIREAFPDEVRDAWCRVGSADVATDPMGIELSDFYIILYPRERWKKAKTQAELTDLIEREVRTIPGQKVQFSQPIEMRIEEMETGVRSDLGVKLYGDDYKILLAEAAKIERVLSEIPGNRGVAVEQVTGQPVLKIKIKQDEIARYGITAQSVLEVVRAVGKVEAGDIVEGQIRVPLVVRLADRDRADPTAIGAVLVTTPGGERVPLSRLATLETTEGPSTISREWGQRRITITSNVLGRDVGSFVAEVREKMKPIVEKLPKGRYHVEYAGEFENYERARERLLIVVPAGVFLIFLLLCLTYHNVVDAFRVLTGVPFGWVGGVLALWVRDLPFSISAAVGFIALTGVAVLDDMILVSYVRQLRRQGVPVEAALRGAAITRLRPVLMTTLVASFGFLPMALSTSQGAEVQRPLATVVIGGVIGAMIMSLLVLRVLYLIFDAAAHAAYWVLVRVLPAHEKLIGKALGLDFSDDEAEAESAEPTLPIT